MDAPITNFCPYGCTALDENGYCRHLVGFSDDGKSLEPLEAVRMRSRKDEDGNTVAGEFVRWRVNGRKRQPVQKGDKLVNPETPQLDKGIVTMAKRWVSARVYRDVPEVSEEELEQLTAPAAAK